MPSTLPSDSSFFPRSDRRRRLFGSWWKRQSPARQDRFATLGPVLSVLMFLAAIIAAFWYLRNEEFEREQESVKRDTEIAQQQIRLRLIENQEQLVRMAREVVTRTIDPDDFLAQAASFTRERPEVTNLIWVGANRMRRASYSAANFHAETGISAETTSRSLPIEGSATIVFGDFSCWDVLPEPADGDCVSGAFESCGAEG